MSHVWVFVKEEYSEFTSAYLAKNKEESLGRMMRRIVYQRGFSFRRPTKSVLSTLDLEAEQRKFASEVGSKISATYARSCIFNADETAVYYDDTPTRIISERGAKKGVKIKGRVRSERASVLLIVSATGQKLRPLIIFKGQSGVRVEEEVQGHSDRVMATVQTNTWMDSRVWRDVFIENAWGGFVCDTQPGPLAIYVDNLKCHVSTKAQDAFATWGTEVVPLPKNTISVLQPLDVGVMGPFKQKLRAITLSYELSVIRETNRVPLRERLLKLQRLPVPEKRKRLVERVVAAWDAVSESSIKKAWSKAGL
ncbi:hypothetical protein PF002_g8403 [Phytophthora fragariae]|uniref:DDE-1 domain-containing protein n=3 Tax=Phytophthora TaxID=4783 RepID=A0A6A3ZSV2_9STRA|nr:hypothetical protein PF002_g8403 [Phytophthora fragariae]